MQSISVRHNIEVAHRLYATPGKCEAIHGHSMWVTLTLYGNVNERGMLAGLDFADVKKSFRGYLDSNYDHHLLLNQNDPFAKPVLDYNEYYLGQKQADFLQGSLPGLVACTEDPTTENIAKWIGERMQNEFNLMEAGVPSIETEVWETSVNKASWRSDW